MAERVAAVIVNYNSGAYLSDCVRSLLRSATPMGIHVVDNASTDDSVEQLTAAFGDKPNLSIIRNPDNVGFATANNQVLSKVLAEYFVLINPDCTVEPETISRLLAAMESDAGIGIASCLIRNSDGSVQKTCRRRFPTPLSGLGRVTGLSRVSPERFRDFDYGDLENVDQLEDVEAISGAFFVVRAESVKKVGLLDEGYFMHCEDLDWCMRFWQSGFRVVFVPEGEVIHHKGVSARGREMRVDWHLHKGMLRFYQKFYAARYPRIVWWLVYAGIVTRFVLRSIKNLLKRALPMEARTAS